VALAKSVPGSATLPASPHSLKHKPSKGFLPFSRKASSRSTIDAAPTISSTAKKMGGISNKDFEDETVRLQKVEFEIVKPMRDILRLEDAGHGDSEVSQSLSDLPDGSRPSIALSVNSNGAHSLATDNASHEEMTSTSKLLVPSLSAHTVRPVSVIMDEQTIEDHRARELKWIKSLATMTPAALRKNKKMRAMVQAGIPSSVRGRVWSFMAEADEVRVENRYQVRIP
jgi:hypothetical protein